MLLHAVVADSLHIRLPRYVVLPAAAQVVVALFQLDYHFAFTRICPDVHCLMLAAVCVPDLLVDLLL